MTTATTCVVCLAKDGTVNTKPLNGCPVGIVICPVCVAAVKARQVGIVLHVTDGRELDR